MSSHWTSSPCYLIERSVRELNPVFLLTTQVCCRNTYRPLLVSSDPGWTRTSTLLHVTQASSPLDHGINQVIEVGVEPTKSPGSRPDRFASLRTRPCWWWRVRELHPTSEAHEASWSSGSTRELQAPDSNRVTDRMKVSSVPTGLHQHLVAKRRVELLPDQRRARVPLRTTF